MSLSAGNWLISNWSLEIPSIRQTCKILGETFLKHKFLSLRRSEGFFFAFFGNFGKFKFEIASFPKKSGIFPKHELIETKFSEKIPLRVSSLLFSSLLFSSLLFSSLLFSSLLFSSLLFSSLLFSSLLFSSLRRSFFEGQTQVNPIQFAQLKKG